MGYKIAFDPGMPTTWAIFLDGKVIWFEEVDSPDNLPRPERIDLFVRRLSLNLGRTQFTEAAVELMGDSGPTFKKKGLISLATSLGILLGILGSQGIPFQLIHTGRWCKLGARQICKELLAKNRIIPPLDLDKPVHAHRRDAVLIGHLAGFDR